jgi:hypothetical protein
MCESVCHENIVKKLGSPVDVWYPEGDRFTQLIWSGFAQKEKFNWWMKVGKGETCFIKADSFVEGKLKFALPNYSKAILAVSVNTDVYVDGRIIARPGSVRMITRGPMNALEQSVHKRWPYVFDDSLSDSVLEFTAEHIVLKPRKPSQLSLL